MVARWFDAHDRWWAEGTVAGRRILRETVAFGCAISVSLDWAARSWDWWAMILKPIHEVGPDDLQALVDNGVRESKTIE